MPTHHHTYPITPRTIQFIPFTCVQHCKKMADKEVCSDLRSNLFRETGGMSSETSETECSCCNGLNNKLKCALDEVSSLNFYHTASMERTDVVHR
jgi:hypothetical protein